MHRLDRQCLDELKHKKDYFVVRHSAHALDCVETDGLVRDLLR
jgi:hypothetical protein